MTVIYWIAKILGMIFTFLIASLLGLIVGAYLLLNPFWGRAFTPERWLEAGSHKGLSDWQSVKNGHDLPEGKDGVEPDHLSFISGGDYANAGHGDAW